MLNGLFHIYKQEVFLVAIEPIKVLFREKGCKYYGAFIVIAV